jgi:hypothetical protein
MNECDWLVKQKTLPAGVLQPVVTANPFMWDKFLKRMNPVPAFFNGVNEAGLVRGS